MKIILLSGGSGKRLWPLSNDCRSKQFLKVLTSPSGEKESMTQRVIRQISESGMKADVTIATSANQKDIIISQFGDSVRTVVEPMRRDTFPAIALSCAYLHSELDCPDDEVVVVLPCDQFTEAAYFEVIRKMGEAAEDKTLDLVLMGIEPESPSPNFGYILPERVENGIMRVGSFVEKPNAGKAEEIIEEGGLWNGGVFAFRLGYVLGKVSSILGSAEYSTVLNRYSELPKISFDYEVVEKAGSIGVITFKGEWKDLGSWDTLTAQIDQGSPNCVISKSRNTTVVNELDIPVICLGTDDITVAASHDGILVTGRGMAGTLKEVLSEMDNRPRFEERRWGEFRIIDCTSDGDGNMSITKRLTIKAGKNISYQLHNHRSEVWTIVKGKGLMVVDGKTFEITPGETVRIAERQLHTIKAVTDLEIIEVQFGTDLREDDIERFDWEW